MAIKTSPFSRVQQENGANKDSKEYAFSLSGINDLLEEDVCCPMNEFIEKCNESGNIEFLYFNSDQEEFIYASKKMLPQHLEAIVSHTPFSVYIDESCIVKNLVYSEKAGLLVSLGDRKDKNVCASKEQLREAVKRHKLKEKEKGKKGKIHFPGNPKFKQPRARIIYNNMGHGKRN